MNWNLPYSEEIEEILYRLCEEMDMPLVIGREALWYMFRELKERAKNRILEDIWFMHLGTFKVTPKKLAYYNKKWGKS